MKHLVLFAVPIFTLYSLLSSQDNAIHKHVDDQDSSSADQPSEHSHDRSMAWSRLALETPNLQIKSLEFETFAEPEWNVSHVPEFVDRMKATRTYITDATILKVATFCFADRSCLRGVVQPGIRGGEGSAYLIGMLTIETNEGKFRIGIGNTGFSIDGNVPGLDTEFYSPAGAELANLLYCKKVGVPLRESLLAALSGTRFIAERCSTFRRLEYTELLDKSLEWSAERKPPQ